MQNKIKDKIEKNEFTISELNKLLNTKFIDAISKFSIIKLKGEIIDCKIFKNKRN